MRLNDRTLGALVTAGGAALLAASLRLPGVPGQDYGAGFFPAILAVALVLAGLALVAGGLREAAPAATPPEWFGEMGAVANVLLLAGIVATFAAAGDRIGFEPFAVVVMFAMQWRLGIPPARALLIALAGAAIFHLLFVRVLRVPLPPGLLAGWL